MSYDIYDRVTSFYSALTNDGNHRYKSWEHCYSFFTDDGDPQDIDTSCLHLSFYLASWGMYRGSSFLLWKDYRIHKAVVKKMIASRRLQTIDFSSIEDAELDIEVNNIIDLARWVKNWYQENVRSVNGEDKSVNVTDTLVTKIILGTLGCVPAYDRYFISGARNSGISCSKLTKKNFKAIVKFYKEHHEEFHKAQNFIRKKSGVLYPAMKVADMYFWETGFQLENTG